MAEEVLGCWTVARLGYRVQDEYEEQLQAVRDQDLSLVLEDNVIVWYTPCSGVVFEGLQGSAVYTATYGGTHCVQEGAENRQNDLLIGTCRNVRDGLDALDWEHTRRHVHGLAG